MSNINDARREYNRFIRKAHLDGLEDVVIQRLRWLAYAAMHDGNIERTCRYFGIARSTFIRWSNRFDPDDLTSLSDHSRRPLSVRTPETDPRIVKIIEDIRIAMPLLGKQKICDLLQSDYGIEISSATVGRILTRYGFFFADTESHRQKRLYASGRKNPVIDEKEKKNGDNFLFIPLTGLTS